MTKKWLEDCIGQSDSNRSLSWEKTPGAGEVGGEEKGASGIGSIWSYSMSSLMIQKRGE